MAHSENALQTITTTYRFLIEDFHLFSVLITSITACLLVYFTYLVLLLLLTGSLDWVSWLLVKPLLRTQHNNPGQGSNPDHPIRASSLIISFTEILFRERFTPCSKSTIIFWGKSIQRAAHLRIFLVHSRLSFIRIPKNSYYVFDFYIFTCDEPYQICQPTV